MCKTITELAVDLVVSENGEDYITGAPTTGAEDAGEDEAVGSSAEAAGDAAGEEEDKSQAASTKSSYVTPSSDEEHRKQLDDAVTLLTDNLQPVPGTTGAVSEGASKFASLGGMLCCALLLGWTRRWAKKAHDGQQ